MSPSVNEESTSHREPPVSELGGELLAYLRDLERGRGGYELYGVRGWASAPEIQDAVQNRRRQQNAPQVEFSLGADELRSLASKRLLTRADARIPGAGKAVWLYRIVDAAARRVAAVTGTEHDRVRPPLDRPEPRVFLRPSVRAALDALKHANQQRGRREWIAGQTGWRTSYELSAWVKAQPRSRGKAPRLFFTEDLAFCVGLGLAERRDDPKIIYRITPVGRDLRPLVWRDPVVSG